MKNKYLWPLKLLISLALLGYLGSKVDLYRLKDILLKADIQFLMIPIAIFFVGLAISSIKWGSLLRVYGLSLPFLKVFRLAWLGSYFNNFLPTSFGGDAYKFIVLDKEYPGNKSILLSSMLLERGLGVLAALMIVCIFAPLVDDNLLKRWWNLAALLVSMIGLISIVFVLVRKGNFIGNESREGFIGKILRLISIFLSFSSPVTLVMAIGISVIFVFLNAFSIYSLFLCFGYHPPVFLIFYLHPLISLFGLLPISINNFGVAESASYVLYSLYGISPEAAVLVYFAGNLLLVLCTSTGGLLFVIKKS